MHSSLSVTARHQNTAGSVNLREFLFPVSRPDQALVVLTNMSSPWLSSHRNACHSRVHTVKKSSGPGREETANHILVAEAQP